MAPPMPGRECRDRRGPVRKIALFGYFEGAEQAESRWPRGSSGMRGVMDEAAAWDQLRQVLAGIDHIGRLPYRAPARTHAEDAVSL